MTRSAVLVLGVFAPLALGAPGADEILARLRKEHPRLLVTAGEFRALGNRVSEAASLTEWAASIRGEADATLKANASASIACSREKNYKEI